MGSSQTDQYKPHDRPAMVHAVKTMPTWKWKILGFAFAMGCVGVGGEATSYFLKHPRPATTVNETAPASPGSGYVPSGSSGFVSGQPSNAIPDSTSASPPSATAPTLTDAITPFLSHFGFSLFVGVIVGLIFRTFIRMAMLTTALIVGGAMALSYFHILNVDLTMVKNETAQATSWVNDQGDRLKDMLFHALPSSTAAGLGFLFGFKKK
jgi:uncharacterized membrane protein (Fun14 family)